MKTLFSILFGLIIAGGGIVLAMNAPQDDPLCLVIGHDGYSYPQGEIPPETSNPENLPENMTYEGQFEQPGGFECTNNPPKTCHWVYDRSAEVWKPCSGDLTRIGTEG